METLLLAGITIFLGAFGAKVSQKLKIPQVVGFIVVGVVLGESVSGVLRQSTIELFTPIINVALGLIGFRIGSELKGDIFRKYGRSIYTILFTEGLGAFFIVALLVSLVTKKLYLGLLLGAVASATAPAATTDVLWEYKTKGPLTTTLLAIIALDDALSLIIYGFASVFAESMLRKGNFTFLHSIAMPLTELSKSCLLGVAMGWSLSKLFRYIKDKEQMYIFTIAAIIFTIGVSIWFNFDFILSAMVLGAAVANLVPQESRKVSESIEKFSPPIYVLFFVLVGARLKMRLFLNAAVALLAVTYLIGRTSGKISGAFFGALLSKASKPVRKYLGLCLFSQAGVAIGLAMVIYHNFSLLGPPGREVGLLVVNIITATTFVVQIVGPPCVKFAVTKADEVFRNVTVDDIIESSKVSDFMRRDFSPIRENATLDKIMNTIKERETYHFPVVNSQDELVGLISLGSLKDVFREQQLDQIILAKDIAVPAGKILYQEQPLREAFDIFDDRKIDYLPVIQDKTTKKVVGIVEYQPLIEAVNRKVFERQKALENERE
jgi:Kef-type K+ transport system membrane component KefB/CBS domain-containing protein